MFIFEGVGSRIIKTLKIPSNIEVIFSGKDKNTFSNREIFNFWIQNIYLKELPQELHGQVLLLLDNSGTHASLLDYEGQFPFMFLPENTTGKLQPLDLTVNHPFKARIRLKWEEFMSNNSDETNSGYFTGIQRDILLDWVSESWRNTTKDSIINGFNLFNDVFEQFKNLKIEEDEDKMNLEENDDEEILSYGSSESFEDFEEDDI